MTRQFNAGDACMYKGVRRVVEATGTSINKRPVCRLGHVWVLESELRPEKGGSNG